MKEEKDLNYNEEKEIKQVDEDQVFGDNNQPATINIAEREENLENLDEEDTARRTRDIIGEANSARDRLNRQKNEVRNYGEDAREIPMA